MKLLNKRNLLRSAAVLTCALMALMTTPAFGQDYGYQPPPTLAPGQLDQLVGRIALYPDPLLAQVLAAATFPDQIPDAAAWADQYNYLRGDDLANAIAQANLPWDPSVQALLPFPDVLDMMAQDMDWTNELGNAVLEQRPDVMDAVQRMRREAESYGYLRSSPQMRVVDDGGWVELVPVNPAYVWVPTYDPLIVFAPPRPGFFVGGAIHFGFGFTFGVGWSNWGWGGGFDWHAHNVIVHNAVWGRNWTNRNVYVHNYGNWNGGRWRQTVVNRNFNANRNRNVNEPHNYQPPARNFEPPARNNQPPAQAYQPPARNFQPPAQGYQPPARNNPPPARVFQPQQNTRPVNNGNQRFNVQPNRGYEQHPPEHAGALQGTQNGRAEHTASAWGQASRGGGNGAAPRGGNQSGNRGNERGGRR